jgi:hypothetical protein
VAETVGEISGGEGPSGTRHWMADSQTVVHGGYINATSVTHFGYL